MNDIKGIIKYLNLKEKLIEGSQILGSTNCKKSHHESTYCKKILRLKSHQPTTVKSSG